MDEEAAQHLKEYKKELAHLENRLVIMKGLINDIEAEDETVKPAQHDFPNYEKYEFKEPERNG